MARKFTLGTKLLLAFLAVGVIPLSVIGFVSLSQSSKALSRQAMAQLQSVREMKKAQIERFYRERQQDMESLLTTVSTLQSEAYQKLRAVQDIKTAQVDTLLNRMVTDVEVLSQKPEVAETLQKIDMFLQAVGASSDTPMDTENTMYRYMYDTMSPYFASYVKKYNYQDLYIIKADPALVIFSMKSGKDLGANLQNGPLKNEALARVWKRALDTKEPVIEDFSAYGPLDGKQVAFVGAPIKVQDKLVGVIALQITTDPINAIVQRNEGMGNSGCSYLVGKDTAGKISFRSDITDESGHKVGSEVKTPYIERAVNGETGRAVAKDSTGNLVSVAFNPVNIKGINWALLSKVNLEEVIAPKVAGSDEDYFSQFVHENGYYDLMLVTPDGYCFYTVTHESDYRTNLLTGELAGSHLSTLIKKVMETRVHAMSDFAPYAPSAGAPSAFLARPLLDEKKNIDLVVLLQLPMNANNEIMKERAGMGDTGESYIVGTDRLMRSDSRLDAKHHSMRASFADPKNGSIDTLAVGKALAGETGEMVFHTYTGNEVLSAYTPVKLGDITWVLVAEIGSNEAFAVVNRIKMLLALIAGIGIAAILLTAWLVTRSINKPIQRTIRGLTMASEQVSSAAAQLSASSQSLAEGTSEQAASLEETSSSLEEMASMIKQNADNAGQASSLSDRTKMTADECSVTMKKMETAIGQVNEASAQTKKIVKTIDEIAFQTNLLALNAAVEAARAGQAGAGFAVVADEVRNLAMRSAQAAKNTTEQIEDIGNKISEAIRTVAQSVEQFAQVSGSTGKVHELVNEISAASQEQAQGIEQLNRAVHEMDKVIQQNSANAEESASASMDMQSQASTMKGIVSQLTAMVRGGGTDGLAKGGGEASKRAAIAIDDPQSSSKGLVAAKGNGKSKHHGANGALQGDRDRASREINPEEVIPFDDDKSFNDF